MCDAEIRETTSGRDHLVYVQHRLAHAHENDMVDRVEQARSLAELLDPRIFKVNLIPYNPTGSFTGSSPKAIAAFESELQRGGIPTTVRLTRGRDVAAACGQLAAAG